MINFKESFTIIAVLISYMSLYLQMEWNEMLLSNIPLLFSVFFFKDDTSDLQNKISLYLPAIYAVGGVFKIYSSTSEYIPRVALKMTSIMAMSIMMYIYNVMYADKNIFDTDEKKILFFVQMFCILLVSYYTISKVIPVTDGVKTAKERLSNPLLKQWRSAALRRVQD